MLVRCLRASSGASVPGLPASLLAVLVLAVQFLGCADEPAGQASSDFGGRVGVGGSKPEARVARTTASLKVSRSVTIGPTRRMQSRSFKLTSATKAVNR